MPESSQPPQGHWIPTEHSYRDSKYICSHCGMETTVDTCMGKPMYVYCPYCGGQMRVV